MSVNYDRHSVEKRHDKRFLGIFLMFVVVAVVVGLFAAMSISAISGYGIFSFLSPNQAPAPAPISDTAIGGSGGFVALGNGGGGGGSQNGSNGTSVTYQGVLDMLENCVVTSSNLYNMTKPFSGADVCAAYSLRHYQDATCVSNFIIGQYMKNPLGCQVKVNPIPGEHLKTICCSIPGTGDEGARLNEMKELCMESGSRCENSMN